LPNFPEVLGMTIRVKLAALTALVAAFATAPASAPASPSQTAPSSFVFFGSGFGHGVGMSQWGAYGLAKMGWTHQQILTHYYSNTMIGQAAQPGKIRVGLVDGVQYVHVAAVGGPVKLRTDAPDASGTVVATVPAGSSYVVKGGTGSYVIVDGSGKQVAGSVDG
jgi:stage II sporulation protein D